MHDYAGHLKHCTVHTSVTPQPSDAGGNSMSSTTVAAKEQAPSSASTAQPHRIEPTCEESSLSSLRTRSELAWTQVTGAFQATSTWRSRDAGALSVERGMSVWVTSTDESGEWAYAQVLPC